MGFKPRSSIISETLFSKTLDPIEMPNFLYAPAFNSKTNLMSLDRDGTPEVSCGLALCISSKTPDDDK